MFDPATDEGAVDQKAFALDPDEVSKNPAVPFDPLAVTVPPRLKFSGFISEVIDPLATRIRVAFDRLLTVLLPTDIVVVDSVTFEPIARAFDRDRVLAVLSKTKDAEPPSVPLSLN